MIGYNPSHLNKNETLLEAFHRVEAYLIEHPLYQVYQTTDNYVVDKFDYSLGNIVLQDYGEVSPGDVVLFNNVYYAVVLSVDKVKQTFNIDEGIDFRGAQGPQGPQGPKGPQGEIGPQGPKGDSGIGNANLSNTPGTSDTDGYTQKAVNGIVQNPNLLINPNFVINQRGQSEYTNTAKKYTVDRTYSNRSVITPLKDGGIKLNVLSGQSNPYIQQIIENASSLVGKKLTFSISIDGLKYSITITTVVPSADSTTAFYNQGLTFGGYNCNLQLTKYKPSSNPYSVLLVNFTIGNPNDTIINWWKMEIGSVATEFFPPSIADELLKCQRYYQIRSNSYTIETDAIDRPIPMRVNGTTGTTTIDSVTYKYVDAEL